MEPGPLPPHERAWRHPSELGPPPHEPTSTSGRVLIVTSAAVSLVLIGVLALAVTPDHASSPIAGNSTVGSPSPRSFPVAMASSSALTTARRDDDLPVVTPIGDEGWAVTTWEAVAGQTGWTDARLPSGEVVEIEIIGKDPAAGLVVVTLPAATEGYRLAADRPGPTDTVYVNADEPRVVMLDDLVWLDVEEATPVLDGAGALIGLCTGGGRDGTTLMTVDTMPGEAPDAPGAGSTTDVENTVPATPADDSTTVESTSPASTDPETSVTDSTVVETTADSTAPPTTEPTGTTTTLVATTDR